MFLFNEYEYLYGKLYEEDFDEITKIMEQYAIDVVKNDGIDELKNQTFRIKNHKDNDYIRLYHNLKNLLLYRANSIECGSCGPIEIVNASYTEILAIINNKKCYNEITLLTNTILSLDIDSSIAILKALKAVEKNKSINIYDKLEFLKLCVDNYKPISPVLFIRR